MLVQVFPLADPANDGTAAAISPKKSRATAKTASFMLPSYYAGMP